VWIKPMFYVETSQTESFVDCNPDLSCIYISLTALVYVMNIPVNQLSNEIVIIIFI
jgi:hypothetical protein